MHGTRVAVVTAVAGLVMAVWGTAPAHAAGSPVKLRAISHKTVVAGGKATVTPRYSAGKGVKIRSATVSVRRGSTWIARTARSARLAAGTYRVTSKIAYQERSRGRLGRQRTVSRTQTLRVVAQPAPAAQVALPPAPAAPPAPASSLAVTGQACDAESLVKADGTPWVCTFSDEFSGTALDDSKWLPQRTATSGYRIGEDCYVDDPDTIAVGGGVLALTVREEAAPFTCASPAGDYTARHTAGMVSTWGTFAQSRGRFEIRAAFPAARTAGLHSALWLYPQNPTSTFPYSGEIDIAEMYSALADRVVPFIHYDSAADDTTVTNNYCMIGDVSAFHTYTLEWTATTMSIAYDGRVCLTHTIKGAEPGAAAPFDDPFMVVLTQGLGVGFNAPSDATPAIGTTRIDYVRVWK